VRRVPRFRVDGGRPAAIITFGTLEGRVPTASAITTIDQEGCMDLKPLGDRVIVEVLDEEETTFSGIVLPDTAKEKPQRGKVLAVGPGKYEDGKLVPLDVKKGDEVIFSKYGGTEVKVSGDEYLILRESDILAKVATSKVAAKA
jgi:chaperonin GroES